MGEPENVRHRYGASFCYRGNAEGIFRVTIISKGDLILGTRDPSMSEEEFMKNVDERVKRLKG